MIATIGRPRPRELWLPFLLLALAVAATQVHHPRSLHAEASLGVRYDTDGSGYIDRDEVLAAIFDYLDDELLRDDVLELIGLHVSETYIEGTSTDRTPAQEAIEELPWVGDGDPQDVARLERLSAESPQVFWRVMDKAWIRGQDGVLTDAAALLLWRIDNLVQQHGPATARIVGLPFLDMIEINNDEATFRIFQTLLRLDPDGADRLLADPALPGAMWPADVALLYLESQGPQVVAAIEGMPWMHDGMEPLSESNIVSNHPSKARLESKVALGLFEIYIRSPETFLGLAEKPWVRRGVDKFGLTAVRNILDVAYFDPGTAARLVSMSFLDTLERSYDVAIIQVLMELGKAQMEALLDDPLIGGDIGDDQAGTVALLALEAREPDAAAAVRSLPWVQDGVAASESDAALILLELGVESPEMLRAVAQKSWLQDAPGRDELSVLESLISLSLASQSTGDEATALRIVGMPFLEIVDGIDAAAMSSLSWLPWVAGGEYLHATLSHPALSGGITDGDAVVVAALQEVVENRPDLLEVLLDRERLTVETRVLELPYSGRTVVSAIHLAPGATFRTMDILERVLRRQEGFIKVPFPRSHIGLLVADTTPHRGGGGPDGFGVIVDPGFEEDEELIGRGLAYTYWHFSPLWIAGGVAGLFSALSADGASPPAECGIADSLYELDLLALEDVLATPPAPGTGGLPSCQYILGRALFLDLHQSLGESASGAGFARLYTALRDQVHEAECGGVERGACYVTIAFVREADEGSAAIAGPIIRRHYYGD